MGPCCYCGKMIYLERIAERGYHRACHEAHLKETASLVMRVTRMTREHEKRRLRKTEKRKAAKLVSLG